jgi:YggT family protein
MTQAMQFLIDTLFNLVLMVVLLRLWLQWSRADFYNPLSQSIVRLTNPLIIPLRRLIPSIGPVDTAGVVLALLIVVLKLVLIQLLVLGTIDVGLTLRATFSTLLRESLNLVFWVLIIRAILSWFSQGNNPVEGVLGQLTEPMLRPIRRIVPQVGGLDLSILVLVIALQFVQILLQQWLAS